MDSTPVGAIGEKVDTLVCLQCGETLDVSTAVPFSVVVCPVCETKQTVPRTLGPFLLIKFLGKGGMGEVYRGFDPLLKRHVAIKVLGDIIEHNPDAVENFMREARAAAQINSPNVVSIYSVGEIGNQPYIVMELINGGQLDKLIARHPISEEQALNILRDAAFGLMAAQEIGLFHGDIKPENILFDQHGTAKIADFGLAQFLSKGSKAKSGEIWGTPYYIAPEKVKHRHEDYRSDIYSLGATFFHILTGEPPFEGDTAIDVVLARLKQLPPDIRDINPDFHEETALLVNRMLEPEPDMRFPNYASLIADIDKAAVAIKTKPSQRTEKRKTGIFMMIAAALLMLSGIAGWLILSKNPRIFSEDQSKALSAVIIKWGRSRYGFDPSALTAVKADIHKFNKGLPKDSPGHAWITLMEGTIEYFQRDTNDYEAAFTQVSKTPSSGLEAEQKQALDVAIGLAEFMRSTNAATPLASASDVLPIWFVDLAGYYIGIKNAAEGRTQEAVYALERYARKLKPEGAPDWPYAFQYSAQNLADNMRKWQNRGELVAKLIEGGQFDKAQEKLASYHSEAAPLFAQFIEIEIKQEPVVIETPATGATEDTPPSNTTSKKRKTKISRKAKKEAEERRVKAEKEAQKRDADMINDFLRDQAVRISQRAYSEILDAAAKQIHYLQTDEGRASMELEQERIRRLTKLHSITIALLGKVDLPPSVIKSLGGTPISADESGITLAIGSGRRLLRWDEIDNAKYIRMTGNLIAKSDMGRMDAANEYLNLAVLCKLSQAPSDWVKGYVKTALNTYPDIRLMKDQLLPTVNL